MRDREPTVAAVSIFIIVLIWVGGSVNPSQDFAGSALGGALALVGTLLLLSPLLLLLVKRVKTIKAQVVRYIPMRTILLWHIYAGFPGTILVLLHTGHKFNSVLASSLMALTLMVLFTGVMGRYLQRQIGDDVRSKRKLLDQLYQEYDSLSAPGNMAAEYAEQVGSVNKIGLDVTADAVNVVGSIADVESAITARETLKRWFIIWSRAHIFLAIGMYLLIIFHIWSGIHFGLRWM